MRTTRAGIALLGLCVFGALALYHDPRPSRGQSLGGAHVAAAPAQGAVQTETLFAGLWRVDGGFDSSLRIRNELLVAPLDITPILYMEDGTEYDLPPVHLATGGVGVLDVNQALANAPASIASHASQVGSAALRYQYTSPGHVVASIEMLNIPESLIFTTAFNGTDTDHTDEHTVEGLWWRRDSGVGGFVSLANTTEATVSVTIQAIGTQGTREPAVTFNLGAHATQMLDLDSLVGSLPGLENQTGGLGVQYSGPMNAVMVTGGLVNASEGYSAVMPFWFHDTASSSPMPITYASAGIMTGPADPMMGFPAGTRFSPYFVLRNTTPDPLTVSPALNWMTSGGAPVTQNLPRITLGPFSSEQVDMKAILKSQGLDAFSGNLNLSASFSGHAGDLIVATGSVDDTGTYVFEVEPQGVGKSNSKQVSYWTVANGFDTMFNLWSPASEPQDLVVTFYYADGSGSYTLPVHLAASGSTMIDMMMLIQSGLPDANGQTIPMSVTAGSAVIQDAAGRRTPITLVVSGGTYNPVTATCGTVCINCCGYNNFTVTPGNFYCPVGGTMGCTLSGTDCNGGTSSFSANWTSSNTAIMTVNSSGVVTGVAPGTATISGQVNSFIEVTQGQICSGFAPVCQTGKPGGSTGGTDLGVPTNFRQVGSGVDKGNGTGTLEFNYAWDSSTGKLADLSTCNVYETVVYPGSANTYVWPSPPWNGKSTVNPTKANVPATDGQGVDDQTTLGFLKPYKGASFNATQTYSYHCTGLTDKVIFGPVTIARSVSQNTNGSWKYTVTKSGDSATINPLP